jgi:hypothetical protein
MVQRGVQPTPRVLLIGRWSDDEVRELRCRFPVVHGPFFDGNDIREKRLHRDEIDLVAVGDDHRNLSAIDSHAERHTICFCGQTHLFGRSRYSPVPEGILNIASTLGDTSSQAYSLPPTPPPIHALRNEAMNLVTDVRGWWRISESPHFEELKSGAIILANIPNDAILGSICWRKETNSGLAWIPFPVPDRIAWIDAIAAQWAERDRTAFATVLPWSEQLEWLTLGERSIRQSQEAMDREEEKFLRDLASRRGEAQRQLLEAQAIATNGIKRLLTQQSDSLVEIVKTVLIQIGFQVTDSDTQHPVGRRAEDLLVRDPDSPDWIAVVEVKGFEKSGGSANDLRKLDKHVHRFEKSHGRPPSAKWFIVNGQLQLPPSARTLPFASDPHQVEEWAQEDGLLISTVELYRSLVDPSIDATTLRLALRDARGQFRKPQVKL